MKKIKRQVTLIAALIMLVCAVLGIFLLLPHGEQSAHAELVIDSSNKNEYLDITGTGTSTTLNGFKSGKTPTEPFSLVIPKDVVQIKDGAFSGTNVISVSCETGRTYNYLIIGGTASTSIGVFSNCISLTNVDLFESSSDSYRIGYATFKGCSSLKQITIPSGANTIRGDTYYNCIALEEVQINGTNDHTIAANAFRNCPVLKSINTEHVKTVGTNAFNGDRMLTHLDLSGLNAGALGDGSLTGCNSLVDVRVRAADAGVPATVLNKYTDVNGSKIVKVGYYVFCQYTGTDTGKWFASSGRSGATDTRPSQNVSTGWVVNYEQNRWYLVKYEGPDGGDGFNTNKTMQFPTAAELSAAVGSTVTGYDINRYAFNLVHAHNIHIPAGVKIIANNAFDNSASQVIDLSGATDLIYVGCEAFAGDGGSTVYMPNRSNLNSQGNKNDVIWFGTLVSNTNGVPGLIIMPNYNAYEALRSSTHSYWGAFTDVLTFQVPINLHYNNRVYTEYRLWNKTYNYVQQESKLYDYDVDMHLPVQNGYSSSVWYDNATTQNESTRVSESILNAKLAPNAASNFTIELYANTIRKPGNINPDKECNISLTEYAYNGRAYEVSVGGVNSLLTAIGNTTVQLQDSMTVDITEYANAVGAIQDKPDSIKDAGSYKLSVQLKEGYGQWAEPATLIVNIGQREIDLSVFNNHQFQLAGEGRLLSGGTLYFDNSEGGNGIPHSEPDGNRTEQNVDNSYVRYNNAPQAIELVNVLNEFNTTTPVYSVSGTNSPANIIPTAPGSYSTVFTLSLVYDDAQGKRWDFSNNYTFTVGENSTEEQLDERGVQLISAGLSATIIKVWYIVEVDNYFTIPGTSSSGEPDSYSLKSWVYGLGTGSIKTPGIVYGDADHITFTLRYTNVDYGQERIAVTPSTEADNKAITDAALTQVDLSQFGHYINNSMPVGRYELVLYYPAVWTHKTDSTAAPEYSEPSDLSNYTKHNDIYGVYTFNVTAAPLDDSRVAEKVAAVRTQLSKTTTFSFDHDDNVHFLNDEAKAVVQELLDLDVTVPREGVWANNSTPAGYVWANENGWDWCYGGFDITYNLERTLTNEYYNETWYVGTASLKPLAPDQYIIFYQLSAPNWQSLVNPNTDDKSDPAYRRNFYYYVEIYKMVQAPTVSDVTYTGKAVSPYITYYDNTVGYNLTWGDPKGYTDGGDHYVTVTLTDKYYYFLENGVRKQTINVHFNISAADNRWALQPIINGWTYSGAANTVTAHAFYGEDTLTYKYYQGTPVGTPGEYTVPSGATGYDTFADLVNAYNTDGNLNAGSYYILATVAATDDYTGLSYVCTFTVAKRSVTVPSIPAVTYDGNPHTVYLADDSLYTASYEGGDVTYAGTYDITVTLKDNGKNYQWLDGTTVLTENHTTVKFTVNTAQNSWIQSPSAISWQWNNYDRSVNLFSAQPTYWQNDAGESNFQQAVTWYIYERNGTNYTLVDEEWQNEDGTVKHNLKDGFKLVLENGEWVVPEWVADLLNGFNAGTWYLRANVNEGYGAGNTAKTTLDFYGLGGNDTTPVPFVILVASNSWVASPGVRGWIYSQFNNGISLTAAVPAYGSNTVKYTVTDDAGNAVDPVLTNFTLAENSVIPEGELLTKLNGLSVGSYKLTVSVPASDKQYGAFGLSVSFAVGKAKNDIQAVISDWTYGATNVTIAVTYPSKTADSVETYAIAGGGTYTSQTAFLAAMNDADNLPAAGTYSLTVSVAGTADYDAASTTVTFTINTAENSWVTVPAIKVSGTVSTQWSYTNSNANVVPEYKAAHEGGTYTVTYYSAKQSGGSYEMDTDQASSVIPVEAGHYFMVVQCSNVANYKDLSGYVFFEITKGTNNFTREPDVQGTLTYKSNNVSWITPTYLYPIGDAAVTVTIDGVQVAADNVVNELNSLDAGNHTVVFSVPATDNCNAFSKTISFEIRKADFNWTETPNVTDAVLPESAKGWVWGSYNANYITLGSAVIDSTTSATVNYVISDTNGNTYPLSGMATANVGSYTLTVTATVNGNYNDKSATVNFSIAKAGNGWLQDYEPGTEGPYEWKYGTAVNVTATFGAARAEHGTVSISYKTKDGSTTYNDLPTTVGEYYVVYSVAGTANYDSLSKEVLFEIVGADQESWKVGYGVSSFWSWNNYNKNTHVFRGVPESGGQVSYAVYDGDTEIISKFTLDDNGLVSDGVAAQLNALVAKTYTLKVYVDAYLGYKAFDNETTITVSVAPNSWEVSPTIAPWVAAYWQDNLDNSVGNVPQGLAKYGTVKLTVYAVDKNGAIVYDKVYYQVTRNSEAFNEVTNDFRDSTDGNLAGRYALVAEVDALTGQYAGIKETVYFQIFESSEEIPSNYWLVIPAIDNWTAGDTPSQYRGAPSRGDKSLTYTFYVLNFNETSSVWEEGDEIAFAEIVKAGRYRMVVEVYGNDPTNRDHMRAEIDFNVDKRVNNWTVSPSIENWFLSGTPSKPVYETTEKSEVTIRYQRIDVANSPITETVPGEAGEYRMYVTAKAEHCDDLEITFDFKVMLATNTWEKIPSIENWSEEFDPNNPTASAAFGEVVYEYFTKDGRRLDAKPTTEGTYIMRATVEAYGYAPLVEEIEFTIEPAFDMTFILIDTALAVVAIALTITLIAIITRRKNKC